jgi:hypothetical protein
MRQGGTKLVLLAAALTAGSASAITLTGLTPNTQKVKVGQPVTLTLTATGVPPQGPPLCFFNLTHGDGSAQFGPEIMSTGFVSGSAPLGAFSYAKAGTFTVIATPRSAVTGPQNPLLETVDEQFLAEGVTPCQGSATATVTVWDPYHEPVPRSALHLPPPPEGANGPSKPGPGPVETTMLHPGAAVALNPQPLPPGSHTDSLQTGQSPVAAGGTVATAWAPPRVRAAALSPALVLEGTPVRLALTADQGCMGVRIAWGDGSVESLNPNGRGMQRPIQHVYRKVAGETVMVAGENGCQGQAAAAVTVTGPMQLRAPGYVAPAAHR